ncbi:MAG: hypothetical protein COX07_02560 [Bacteroidetes bacterium CG23_combo_of_CG06-09_8_20_14_all_32_9]|nr:MAG: hypothetical protein COX07_02560 [Bacteroidetes bacterium CG23_combo_of_CG06-09_8_20_14_all_32_9]
MTIQKTQFIIYYSIVIHKNRQPKTHNFGANLVIVLLKMYIFVFNKINYHENNFLFGFVIIGF